MKKLVWGIFVLVLLVNFVCSTNFEKGEATYELTQTHYGPRASILGWINISLEDFPSNAIFEDSRGNEITLIELLNKNTDLDEGVDYECDIKNCDSDYTTNAEISSSFSLNLGQSKLIGIKLTGIIKSVDSVSLNISSNALASCGNQLKIDFLNDGGIDKGNTKASPNYCPYTKTTGCFNESKSLGEYVIGNSASKKYCQKMNLSESPGFRLGAFVNLGGDSRRLIMEIYDLEGNAIKDSKCDLPSGEGELSCGINFSVSETKEYYVCIYSNSTGTSTINGYDDSTNGCGFYGTDESLENAAYKIFAEGKEFDAIENIEVLNSLEGDENLNEIIQDYLIKKYGREVDCGDECIIPIKITSNSGQTINLKDLNVQYTSSTGAKTSNKFYEISEEPAKINSEFIKIFLDEGDFQVTDNYGNFTFKLYLDNTKIFSEVVSVEKVPTINYVRPRSAAQGFPINFKVYFSSSSNISKYKWDFEGDEITTITNEVSYTFNSTGEYELTITLTDTMGKSSLNKFNITVNDPKKEIESRLDLLQKNLEKIKAQINGFDLSSQQFLNSYLGLDDSETNLIELQRSFTQADSDGEYEEIIGKLLSLNIPDSITKTKSANSILYYPNKEFVETNALQYISSEEYDSDKEKTYSTGVLSWSQEKVTTKLTFNEFSFKEGDIDTERLNVFLFEISENEFLNETPYFILRDLKDLKFKENYDSLKDGGYIYIKLDNLPKTIGFSTTEEVTFVNLPLFISPAIESLPLLNILPSKEKQFKIIIFILVLVLLFIIGLATYIILQIWYKRKYESYLFKNRNNLYNLVNYINNSKKQGMGEKEIIKNLKKAKWSSEQIDYVMKKYAGKRTGMYEIPIENALKFLKKNEAPTPMSSAQNPGVNSQMRRNGFQVKKEFIPKDKFLGEKFKKYY